MVTTCHPVTILSSAMRACGKQLYLIGCVTACSGGGGGIPVVLGCIYNHHPALVRVLFAAGCVKAGSRVVQEVRSSPASRTEPLRETVE